MPSHAFRTGRANAGRLDSHVVYLTIRVVVGEPRPIGWDPDLDDGVRLNIRPFVRAGILRDTPNISWRKDRDGDAATAPWYEQFQGGHNGQDTERSKGA